MPGLIGLDKLLRELGSIRTSVAEAAERGVEEAASACLIRAKQLAPVRTGRLRSSIAMRRLSSSRASVEASAPYAGFVEHGTRYMKPRPYMRPAVSEATAILVTRFSKIFRGR